MFAEGWGEPPKRYTVWAGRDVGERASGSQWFTRRLDKPRAAGHAPRARTARQRPLDRGPAASDRSIAVPPAQLSRRARAALWLFRIFALVVSFLVIYTFVSQLH